MDKQKILNDIFLIVKNDLLSLNIPVSNEICPIVRISKAKRQWGSCKMSKKYNDYKFYISISENCFSEPNYIDFIKNTVAHELIHTVKGCFNHSKGFKYYSYVASKLGYNVTVKSESKLEKSDEEKFKEANHILKCTVCGQLYYRYRFPKDKNYINKIVCGKCRGRLVKIK